LGEKIKRGKRKQGKYDGKRRKDKRQRGIEVNRVK
jgi:hypothetical protein